MQKTFEEVRDWALFAVRASAPIRTGRLRDSFHLVIYKDGWGIRTEIPYMEYTTWAWTFNKHWGKTLKNPNENWFRNVAIVIAEELARRQNGAIRVV